MSELEEKLNSLLSDPDGMAQVLDLAKKLSGESGDAPPPPPAETGDNGLSALLGSLLGPGAPDAQTIARLLPVLGQLDRPESGEAAALLYALRPFLREERRNKVERAVRLARLLHLGKAFLAAKEDGHV